MAAARILASAVSGPYRYQRMTGRWLAASGPSAASSPRRLSTATISAPRLHTVRNQPDGGTWVAAAPPSARRTNPEATQPSSTSGTCLSASEYRNEMIRYAATITVSSGAWIHTPAASAAAAARPASTRACAAGSAPEATGLRHFTGWRRSRSASTASLTKYTADEAAVKAAKATIA